MGETTSPAETCIVLLGGFSVSVAGQPIADRWRLRKAKTLVKLFALAPGHRLHRDIVVDLLWPEAEPQATAHNLHELVAVDGPDPIGSAAYATDFNEVKRPWSPRLRQSVRPPKARPRSASARI